MSNRDTAFLINHLHVPMAVRDMLENPDELQDVSRYALHSALGDLRPDAALLAASFSIQTLISAIDKPSAGDAVLNELCARLIADYAPHFEVDHEAAQGFLMEALPRIESDLRGLHAMLETASAIQKDHKISTLLKIVAIQTRAQADVCEEVMGLMECEFMQGQNLAPAAPIVFSALEEDDYSGFDMDACRFDAPRRSQRGVLSFPTGCEA